MNEYFKILEELYNTLTEDNGKMFALGYKQAIDGISDEEAQGKAISDFKHNRLKMAKKRADYIDEGTAEAFATNFINELKRQKLYNKSLDHELRDIAISYFKMASQSALTQEADTLKRAKSMAAGNGAGSTTKHIPKIEGDLEQMRKPYNERTASVVTEEEITHSVNSKFNY